MVSHLYIIYVSLSIYAIYVKSSLGFKLFGHSLLGGQQYLGLLNVGAENSLNSLSLIEVNSRVLIDLLDVNKLITYLTLCLHYRNIYMSVYIELRMFVYFLLHELLLLLLTHALLLEMKGYARFLDYYWPVYPVLLLEYAA